MRRVQSVHASSRYGRALAAVTDFLTRLKLEFAFVGNVARSAWLGSRVECGSLDLIALINTEQKSQVAMMANGRGFRVEREEIDAEREELDLDSARFADPEGTIRIHVLVGSNALYGRMVTWRCPASFPIGMAQPFDPAAEDLPHCCSPSSKMRTAAAIKRSCHPPSNFSDQLRRPAPVDRTAGSPGHARMIWIDQQAALRRGHGARAAAQPVVAVDTEADRCTRTSTRSA